jgi:hypothetical protein
MLAEFAAVSSPPLPPLGRIEPGVPAHQFPGHPRRESNPRFTFALTRVNSFNHQASSDEASRPRETNPRPLVDPPLRSRETNPRITFALTCMDSFNRPPGEASRLRETNPRPVVDPPPPPARNEPNVHLRAQA